MVELLFDEEPPEDELPPPPDDDPPPPPPPPPPTEAVPVAIVPLPGPRPLRFLVLGMLFSIHAPSAFTV